jgi:hypothetical protein
MRDNFEPSLEHLAHRGFVMLRGIFPRQDVDALAARLTEALQTRDEPSILRSRGQVYGARNLLETYPNVTSLLSRPMLFAFTTAVLGADAGVVRALYFDKPPDRSWSLPWHQDRTIAVKRNDLSSEIFCKPTVKAGVAHVEAPASILMKMLTIRIHLDAMTELNGPLYVIPGSHRRDDPGDCQPVELHAEAGDVLAMRPLLTHSSAISRPGTTSHRRVIHFEMAAIPELPDGFDWHAFIPIGCLAP